MVLTSIYVRNARVFAGAALVRSDSFRELVAAGRTTAMSRKVDRQFPRQPHSWRRRGLGRWGFSPTVGNPEPQKSGSRQMPSEWLLGHLRPNTAKTGPDLPPQWLRGYWA